MDTEKQSITALGGSLTRTSDGWRWSDGTPGHKIRDITLRSLAPNFRYCNFGTVVKIQRDWARALYWPQHHMDPDAVAAIRGMLSDGSARRPPVRMSSGYLIPVSIWDRVMGRVIGATWDKKEEAAILRRAKSLRIEARYSGPGREEK